jgi:hypothetical protein
MGDNVKTCSKCKTLKELTAFSKNRTKDDGHNTWCKECSTIHGYSKRKKDQIVGERKTCSSCRINKIKSEFYISRSKTDGLCSQCKTCMNRPRPYLTRKSDVINFQSWNGGDEIFC